MYETGLAEAGASGLTGADRPADLTDRQLLVRVTSRLARCADSSADADDWFPVATRWSRARTEAARALALCAKCPVRAHCLELSMREWDGAGRYGVWGGLLEAERAAIRKEWLSGVSVSRLLETRTAEASPPS
jgi:WhiB family redox-sensing transcriptional regulator